MNWSFLDFLNLCGGLGLFLFGMTMMSESLQKVAGEKMRSILANMTKNRVMGVLTGVIITSIIQSSSATTVMVVSFVNAGLLSLAEAISVIMGANIGTTVTAWLVSLVGFKFSIVDIAIPIIGLSIPLLFSKYDRRKSIGELMVGFALLFIGLEFLKNSVPDINTNPEVLAFLQKYVDLGYGSILLFVFIGTILTLIMQSSSATMAITLVMLNQGWIGFEIAAAMVLGENIGTTITANLAAIPANTNAKRAALSHTLFNVFGVIWGLILFYPFTRFVLWAVTWGEPSANTPLYALSLFHTMFNTINVCVMIWFVKLYEKIVTTLIKEKKTDSEFGLQFISGGLLSTGELSLIEAEKEIEYFAQRTLLMFKETRQYAVQKHNDKSNQEYAERIEQFENASDKTDLAIADYLHEIAESPISLELKRNIRNYIYVTSEIETIADCCYNISRTATRKNKLKFNFTAEQLTDLNKMFDMVEEQLNIFYKSVLKSKIAKECREEILRIENDIDSLRYTLKIKSIDQVNNGTLTYASSTHFMDMIEECERLADAITKVAMEKRM
ncbi:MAG TPA: Na/Pi cotransporter family protein [Paludibacteraceae bacterium]|nr:Na/Pi cotransporter family protein [Paludibacteraceae bacterium]HQB69544.1 Na/Pi cotransporter family protein [Paludibacteraceae bacterium]